MSPRTIAKIAAVVATIGIAGLPLTVITPANAINKHETGGRSTQSTCLSQQTTTPPWTGRNSPLGRPPDSP
jgi:hypothetical protein